MMSNDCIPDRHRHIISITNLKILQNHGFYNKCTKLV